MNPPKCDDLDYIHFLIAAQRVFTCTKAARCQPQAEDAPAYDAFTRLLQRQPFNTKPLWRQVNPDDRNVISSVNIPPEGRVVHLRGFGRVKVFQKVSRDGELEYFATNALKLSIIRDAIRSYLAHPAYALPSTA